MIWRTLAAVAALSVASPALAVQCGPADAILKQLRDEYGEAPAFTGDARGVAITILVSPTGTWTVIARQGDQVCLIAAGDKWSAKAGDKDKLAPVPQSLPAPVLLRNGQRRI